MTPAPQQIVAALRSRKTDAWASPGMLVPIDDALCQEAADLIGTLQSENAAMRGALEDIDAAQITIGGKIGVTEWCSFAQRLQSIAYEALNNTGGVG